jgi:nucleoside-diphosphate-sugar epimerase
MKVLILGGAGFIGRHLTHALATHPASEILLVDLEPPAWDLSTNARFTHGDVRSQIDIGDFAPDLLVNLAAIHRTPGHPDSDYHTTNETGAHCAVALCRRYGIARMWFTSSISVYGPSEAPVCEASTPNPQSAYGRSKLAAETIHRDWAVGTPGARLVIVRPATVFGPGEMGNFTRLARSLASRTFFYPGRRDTKKACGYVDDLVSSLLFAEKFAAPDITYNFAYPSAPTIEEICRAFCEVADLPKPLLTIPAPALLLAARSLRFMGRADFDPARVEKLIRSTNIQPSILLDKDFVYQTSLVGGLERWFRSNPAGRFL